MLSEKVMSCLDLPGWDTQLECLHTHQRKDWIHETEHLCTWQGGDARKAITVYNIIYQLFREVRRCGNIAEKEQTGVEWRTVVHVHSLFLVYCTCSTVCRVDQSAWNCIHLLQLSTNNYFTFCCLWEIGETWRWKCAFLREKPAHWRIKNTCS